MQGREPVGAVPDRVQPGEDLVAQDLADHDPLGIEPQRPQHQIGDRDLAFAFGVRLSGLHGGDVSVPVPQPLQAELE